MCVEYLGHYASCGTCGAAITARCISGKAYTLPQFVASFGAVARPGLSVLRITGNFPFSITDFSELVLESCGGIG